MAIPSTRAQATVHTADRSRALSWEIALGLLLVGILSRWPFQSQLLFHWDSVNLALATQVYDVGLGQPQVPGYVLYVLLGKLLTLWLGDPQPAYVLLSIIASALAPAALYALGTQLWDRRTGLLAALALLSSPLFWFYGEVALPHSVDALVIVVAAFLGWRVLQGHERLLIWFAAWLALAGGLRQQTLVFLLPLALLCVHRVRWTKLIAPAIVGAALCLAWLIPLGQVSGGLERYFAITAAYSQSFNAETSVVSAGLSGLTHNLSKIIRYTAYGWGLAALPVVLWLMLGAGTALLNRRNPGPAETLRVLRWQLRLPAPLAALLRDQRSWFLLIWAVPGLAFYTFIHMGQQGLIFVYLPVLCLLSALALRDLLKQARLRYAASALAVLVLLGNSAIFLFAPEQLGATRLLTRAAIINHDTQLAQTLNAIRGNFRADQTVLLADEWRHVQYYLPEFALVTYRSAPGYEGGEQREIDAQEQAAIARAHNLVWFESELGPLNQSPQATQSIDGVWALSAAPGQLYVNSESFGIRK